MVSAGPVSVGSNYDKRTLCIMSRADRPDPSPVSLFLFYSANSVFKYL